LKSRTQDGHDVKLASYIQDYFPSADNSLFGMTSDTKTFLSNANKLITRRYSSKYHDGRPLDDVLVKCVGEIVTQGFYNETVAFRNVVDAVFRIHLVDEIVDHRESTQYTLDDRGNEIYKGVDVRVFDRDREIAAHRAAIRTARIEMNQATPK
jgi:hypothetical protein